MWDSDILHINIQRGNGTGQCCRGKSSYNQLVGKARCQINSIALIDKGGASGHFSLCGWPKER